MAQTLSELKRRLQVMQEQGMLSGLSAQHTNLSPAAKMLLGMLSRPGLLPRPPAPVPVPPRPPVPAPSPPVPPRPPMPAPPLPFDDPDPGSRVN